MDPNTPILTVKNAGAALEQTNFWETAQARAGFCYLSWNAGTARLLVPDACVKYLDEMRSAKIVIVSRGPWPAKARTEALEILFDDLSETPFALHMGEEQTDGRYPAEEEWPFERPFTVWTRGGLQLTFEGRFRRVAHIPYLQSWGK